MMTSILNDDTKKVLKKFHNNGIPKLDSNHTFLAEITLDSALKKGDSYYPQVFLK